MFPWWVPTLCLDSVVSLLQPADFWYNDWGILCDTMQTKGWKWYWNKSQHRELPLEKKILLPFLLGSNPQPLETHIYLYIYLSIYVSIYLYIHITSQVYYHQATYLPFQASQESDGSTLTYLVTFFLFFLILMKSCLLNLSFDILQLGFPTRNNQLVFLFGYILPAGKSAC